MPDPDRNSNKANLNARITTLQQTAGQLRAVLHGRAQRPPIPSAPAEGRNVTVTGVAGRCCGHSRGNEAGGQTRLPPAQPPAAPRDGSVAAARLFFFVLVFFDVVLILSYQ